MRLSSHRQYLVVVAVLAVTATIFTMVVMVASGPSGVVVEASVGATAPQIGDRGLADSPRETAAVTAAAAVTKSVNVPGLAFISERDADGDDNLTPGCTTSTADTLFYADIDIPTGATITSVDGHVRIQAGGFGPVVGVAVWTADNTNSGAEPGLHGYIQRAKSGDGYETLSATGVLVVRADRPVGAYARLDVGDAICGMVVHYIPASYDFTAIEPCVIYDSRPGKGGVGAFEARERRTIRAVRASYAAVGGDDRDCGIPAGAHAVEVNLSALNPAASGGLRAFPVGATQPGVDSLAFDARTRTSNAVTVKLGSGDRFYLRNLSDGSTTVQLMVLGYYS